MNFWNLVQEAAAMPGFFLQATAGFLLLSAVLFYFEPAERRRIRVSMVIFAFGLIGVLLAALLLHNNFGVEHFIYRVIRGAALFLLGVAVVNAASSVLFGVILGAFHLHPPRIMRDLLLAFSYIVLVIVIVSRHGADLTGIVATSAVLTAVIGFSLQDTLGNVMGGLALQMERTINVGDWIRVDQTEGRVKEIRWRQTSIETRNWDTVVIPNSTLMKAQVILLGLREGMPRQHRMWVWFNVDFRYPPSEVIDAVQIALRAEPIPNVATEPPPNCVLMDFKESFASYAVRYWLTDMAVDDPTNSVVRHRIYFALRRAGIPISIPAHALFITEDKEKRRERKHHDEIEHRVKALERVELFHTLTDAERHALAEHLKVAPFVRGEALTRQGAEAHYLYIMIQGEAEVRVGVEGSGTRMVAKLKEGDFFGEMGLMTGDPRRATIVALTDVEAYRLDKASFNETVRQRPQIAEDISHILARRNVELETVRENLNEEAKKKRLSEAQGDLLDRISKFFTLGDK
jgi:small-conductance mechanosensitive channel/CRP-like cAMP-binding protein